MVISVSMSAIFFCISWFLARGTPNCILWTSVHVNKLQANNFCIYSLQVRTSKNSRSIYIHYHLLSRMSVSVRRKLKDPLTCPMYIAGQHGNRTQQHLVTPRQCHSEHCLNTQRDPDRRNTDIKTLSITYHPSSSWRCVIQSWCIRRRY